MKENVSHEHSNEHKTMFTNGVVVELTGQNEKKPLFPLQGSMVNNRNELNYIMTLSVTKDWFI